ncbi:MAG: hypothetical protein JWM93_143 [Frankiales bacterium]|nr:hypothetical protein [Frankiales bacterium]
MTAGRLAGVPGASAPAQWSDWLRAPTGAEAVHAGIVEVAAVVMLVVSWGWLLSHARALQPRWILAIGALWAVPLAVGPPLMSLDAYSYLSHGMMATLGIDPYLNAPSVLGSSDWVQGVDPFWRNSRSPYGPVALLLERAVVGTGTPVAGLIALHVIAFASIGVLALSASRLVPRARRTTVLLLVTANPLVLLQLIGAAHWEALLVALLAASLLAWQRAHPAIAIAMASTAAAVKLPAVFAVAVFVVLHVLGGEPGRRLRRVAGGALATVGPWLVLATVVPNVLGFRGALSTPLQGRTMYAPTTLVAEAISAVIDTPGINVPFDTILTFCRVLGLMVAGAACAWLLATARRRPVASTIGLGLLAVAVLGPVTYPWYLTWGLIPLALAGERTRPLVQWVSTVAVFAALPGCRPLGVAIVEAMGPGPAALTGVALATCVVAVIVTRRIGLAADAL